MKKERNMSKNRKIRKQERYMGGDKGVKDKEEEKN